LPVGYFVIVLVEFAVFRAHLFSSFRALRSKNDIGHIMMSAFARLLLDPWGMFVSA
jgi:hypothetical protein